MWIEDLIPNYDVFPFNVDESSLLIKTPIDWCRKRTSEKKIIRKVAKEGITCSHIAIVHAKVSLFLYHTADGIESQRIDYEAPTLGWDIWRDLLESKADRIIANPPIINLQTRYNSRLDL